MSLYGEGKRKTIKTRKYPSAQPHARIHAAGDPEENRRKKDNPLPGE
jgi:hypothetical protein